MPIFAYKYNSFVPNNISLKMPLNIFVKTTANKTITIIIHDNKLTTLTVLEFKQLVTEKNGIPPAEQRLILGTEHLINDDKLLEDHEGIKDNCTIFLVMRAPGGQDECVTCCNQRTLLRAPCKCKEAVYCAECIIRDVQSKVDYENAKLVCPYCRKEWNLIEIQKTTGVGAFSDAQFNAISKKLAQNYINNAPGIRECPGCQSYCMRQDETKNRFYCRVCAMEKRNAEYCFQCSLPWKKFSSHVDCGNPSCDSANPLTLLAAATRKKIGTMTDCPSLRMCPGCATIIEHETHCKQMHCKKCKTDFCFACLKLGRYKCGSSCSVAPVQTTIPSRTSKEFSTGDYTYRCLVNM